MHPFEQQVRERAYFIWEGEGRVFGHATEHWLRAERELSTGTPVQVRPVAAENSLAPSPARALKPKAGARSAAAKAVAATVETTKPVKAPAAKTAKATTTKTASTKATTAKTAASKTAAPKAAAPKSPSPRTVAARSKSFGAEAGVVMH